GEGSIGEVAVLVDPSGGGIPDGDGPTHAGGGTESLVGQSGFDGPDDLVGLGIGHGTESGHDLPAGRYEELLEVPLDVAGRAGGVGLFDQLPVQRMAGVAIDLDLLGDGEGDAVIRGTECGDLLGTTRLLGTELVAR